VFHYRAYELDIASDLVLPELGVERKFSGEPEVCIQLTEDLDSGHRELMPAGGLEIAPFVLRFGIEGVAVFQVEEGRRIQINRVKGADAAEVRVFLLGSALGALL